MPRCPRELRQAGFSQAGGCIAGKGALKSGLTIEIATDLLMTLY